MSPRLEYQPEPLSREQRAHAEEVLRVVDALRDAESFPNPHTLRTGSRNNASFLRAYCIRVDCENISDQPDSLDQIARMPKLRHFAELAGKPLLDIGAGQSALGYALASAVGASAYIGVEPFHGEKLREDIEKLRDNYAGSRELVPYTVAEKDIRQVLRSIPDGSVNVLAAGIDSSLFALEVDFGDRVLGEAGAAVGRVIPSDGILLSIGSELTLPIGVKREFFNSGDSYEYDPQVVRFPKGK